jgi:hypothetical protein
MTALFDARTPDLARWRTFTDRVMGGLSQATAALETVDGEPALVLRGTVRLENNGGFVQVATGVTPAEAGVLGTSAGLALRLHAAAGTPVGVHLRSPELTAPWQAWRATVTADGTWQPVVLRWGDFAPYRTDAPLVPSRLSRLGLVAIGRPGPVAIALGYLTASG